MRRFVVAVVVAVDVAIDVVVVGEPRVELQMLWAVEAGRRLVVEDQLQYPQNDRISQQGIDPGSSLSYPCAVA